MKQKINNILLLISVGSLCYGDEVTTQFVQKLSKERYGEIWINHSTEHVKIPIGGYIFRFEWDIDGDSVDEIFLLSSVDSDIHESAWYVYKKNTLGVYNELGDWGFRGTDMWVKVDSGIRKYSFFSTNKPQYGGDFLVTYWLDASGALKNKLRNLTESESSIVRCDDPEILGNDGKPDSAKVEAKLQIGHKTSLPIQKVLIAKYIQNPNTPWKNIKQGTLLSHQHEDPTDAADIESVQNWTPPPEPTE